MPLKISLFVLLCAWFLLALFSTAVGAVTISIEDIIQLFLNGELSDSFVIWNHRLPRLLIATTVGIALALSGNLVQAVVRNPLASPDILGVTAGAGLGVVTLLITFPDAPQYWVPIAALFGGLLASALLILLTYKSLMHPTKLALVGLALSAVFAASTDYLLTTHPLEINSAMLWMTGSIWGRNWSHLPLILPWLITLIPCAIFLSYRLDLLSLGMDAATGLGENVTQTRVISLVIAIALASISVSVCGAIGFIGIIAPHLARFLVGGRQLPSILVSMLLGALILVSADIVARSISPPIEFPAGIFVALIGAPYFLFLLTRYKKW